MNIVYIITRSDVFGGASVHLIDLVVGMKNNGISVTVLIGGNGVVCKRLKELGISTISIPSLKREIGLFDDFRCYFDLRSKLKALQPDLVHLHSAKAGMLGRIAAKSLAIPVVYTVHGWPFTDGVSFLKKYFYTALERILSPFVDHFITVSEYDRHLGVVNRVSSSNRVTTVHNGINDLSDYREICPSSTYKKLVMVARFDHPKDQAELINAINIIENKYFILELIGDGPLMKKCIAQVNRLCLQDRVIFRGYCDDVSLYLNHADIFILVSNWEGFPLTILEAMRAGLPVIASNVGGVSEQVIDSVNGYLIERGDTDNLANKICDLVDNDKKRLFMGDNSRSLFASKFTFSVMFDETVKIYKRVLSVS